MAQVVTVEEVAGSKELTRFIELPHALHGDDARFAPMVMAWERYRVDPRRNPFFEHGDGIYLLARRRGRPVGRVTAQIERSGGAGQFGFWWLDDDPDVAAALLTAAQSWLADRGCTSMTGPCSFTAQEELGVQVAGHGAPGRTGRPWHPPHLAHLLEAQGFEAVEDRRTWRLPTTDAGPELERSEEIPGQAGAYGDRRIVLQGIAAVPDVTEALRAAGVRAAWHLARRAKAADWDTCTVVHCTAEPSVAVPALQAVAGQAGYRWLVAPWTADPAAEPEAVHRTYRRDW